MRGLTEKTIIVAGGGTGIGAAVAGRLAEEGAHVVVGDINAGVPGTIIPPLQVTTAPPMSNVQPLDWYVIQARGDVNGNSVFARYASTSMTGEIYIENEGE